MSPLYFVTQIEPVFHSRGAVILIKDGARDRVVKSLAEFRPPSVYLRRLTADVLLDNAQCTPAFWRSPMREGLAIAGVTKQLPIEELLPFLRSCAHALEDAQLVVDSDERAWVKLLSIFQGDVVLEHSPFAGGAPRYIRKKIEAPEILAPFYFSCSEEFRQRSEGRRLWLDRGERWCLEEALRLSPLHWGWRLAECDFYLRRQQFSEGIRSLDATLSLLGDLSEKEILRRQLEGGDSEAKGFRTVAAHALLRSAVMRHWRQDPGAKAMLEKAIDLYPPFRSKSGVLPEKIKAAIVSADLAQKLAAEYSETASEFESRWAQAEGAFYRGACELLAGHMLEGVTSLERSLECSPFPI